MQLKWKRVKKGYIIEGKPKPCSSVKKLLYYIQITSGHFKNNNGGIITLEGVKDESTNRNDDCS